MTQSKQPAGAQSGASESVPAAPKAVPPAAVRALSEAAARRAEADRKPAAPSRELQGPKGPDPARYGDWERKGIASDF